MTLTRNEFKELYGLYVEAWHKSMRYEEFINEEFLNDLIFPVFHWIGEKTGLIQEEGELDVLTDLIVFGHVPVDVEWFELPNGEYNYTCDYTNDLDRIYDYYLENKVAAKLQLLEEKLTAMEESIQ